jgi:hypothetical protein
VIGPFTIFHNEVIDVCLNITANLWFEYFHSHYDESSAGILQTLGYSHETEGAKRSDEASFFLVLFRHPALMVA